MALWSRLGDGDRANKIYKGFIKEQSCTSLFALCGKAPQVDGTFGVTAAITEMLMQSHDDYIQLLPALPAEWPEGSFKGVCTRGGFVLDFLWKDKEVTALQIYSRAGQLCRLKAKEGITISNQGKPIPHKQLPDGKIEFQTQAGGLYNIHLN